MKKTLENMTLEELWKLFPIYLTEYNKEWGNWYLEEKTRVINRLSEYPITIYHIGSTAIPNIWAKPIVDILLEIPASVSMEKIKSILIQNGYICMSESKKRKSFCLGYTKNGFADKVYHLHLRYENDHDELYFRDYMIENANLAVEYEKLKISLWKKFEHDRDGYTAAKEEFVKKYTNVARKKYQDRYEKKLVK